MALPRAGLLLAAVILALYATVAAVVLSTPYDLALAVATLLVLIVI